MAYISPMLTNIVGAVKKASINLNRDFSEIERLQNSIKGSLDFTKIAFDKIQKGLRVELGKVLPTIPVVLASEKTPKEGMFLSVSAIEGLANFAHGNPDFAISVALINGDTILAGAIYNPARDELFFAEKGKGAFKEGFRSHERLRVSAKQELEGALVAIKPNGDAETTAKYVNNTVALCKDVRVSGATALDLAYVASGRLDGYFELCLKPWDFCAGELLCREAGAVVTDFEGGSDYYQNGNIVCGNVNVVPKLLKEIKSCANK
jgi:myo-inositol-1(or 4)-monophosphatase